MDSETVIFKIFIKNENEELIEDKEYIFNINDKIIDVKNTIVKEKYGDKYNYINLTNITERVYKDYGKLFFEKGLLSSNFDNYKLSQFTNSNRTFSFYIEPLHIEMKKEIINNNSNNNSIKNDSIKNNKNDFFINMDDFPPLVKS